MSGRALVVAAALAGAASLAAGAAPARGPESQAAPPGRGAPGAESAQAPPGEAAPGAEGALTLAECFRIAVEKNERIGRAQEEFTQALLLKRTALSNVLPRVTLEDTYYRQNAVDLPVTGGTGSAFSFASDRNELLVKLKQPIFSGFRDQNFLAYSRSNIEAFQHGLEESKRLLYGSVAEAFYSALQRQGEVRTLEDSVAVERERLREVQARQEVGLARRTELLLVQSQLSDDEAKLTRARNDLQLAREQLVFLMGVPLERPLQDDVTLPEALGDAPPPVEEALAQRSDMRQRAETVRAARRQVAVARGEHFPTLELEANRYVDRRNYSTFQQETDWSAELSFTFPIFDGGRVRANVLTAYSKLQQAVLLHDELARQIGLELQNAWLTLQSDLARLKTLEASVASSDENYRLLQEEYRGGLANNLEVITAQNLLLSTSLDRERQKYQVGLDWIALQLAQGRLPGYQAAGMDR